MRPDTIEIPDAQGELWAYRLEVPRARPLRVRLTRLDTGAVHEVAAVGSGAWRCSCEDSTFRGWRKRPPAVCCKHVVAVSEWAARREETAVPNEVIPTAERRPLPAGLTLPAPGTSDLPPLVLALLTGQRPGTAKALVKAMRSTGAVPHDGRNEYHRYDYTSAEAIIQAGRDALIGAGLSLLPVEARLVGSERDGPDRFEWERIFLLLHDETGEMTPMRTTFPVVPDKGRPLDKATAAADTVSLAYFLRDLLLMPRVDRADDVAGRDDRAAQPQPAKAAARKTPAKGMPRDGAELEARVRQHEADLVKAGRCKPGDLIVDLVKAGLREGYSAEVADWAGDAIADAAGWVKQFDAAHPLPPKAKAAAGPEPAPDDVDALERAAAEACDCDVEALRAEGKRPGPKVKDEGGRRATAYLAYLKRVLADARAKQTA